MHRTVQPLPIIELAYFHHDKKKAHPNSNNFQFLPSSGSWQPLIYLSISMGLPILDISHQQNHTTCHLGSTFFHLAECLQGLSKLQHVSAF